MKVSFSRYQIFIVAILAFLQFTVVLDFMILSPLGAVLLEELSINTRQFGMVVSAYAFSAGISGLLAAGFADKFDRKKFLMFFYIGFIIGTFLCAIAPDYEYLLSARIITGVFGGVITSISFSIVTDIFPMNIRGRAVGFIMTAFSGSQVLGIPTGIWIANHWGWHSTFMMIAGISVLAGGLIAWKLQPLRGHLENDEAKRFIKHLQSILSNPAYLYAFSITALLTTGGFMLMPFMSAFSVYNLGISMEELPMVFMFTGAATMVTGPIVGKLSDSVGKYKVFVIGSLFAIIFIFYYTGLGRTPLWLVIAISTVMFIAVSSRMIPVTALSSAIPRPSDRGAYMSIDNSVRQLSGGVGSLVAGLIVVQADNGPVQHYHDLGMITGVTMLLTVILMYRIYVKYEKEPKIIPAAVEE